MPRIKSTLTPVKKALTSSKKPKVEKEKTKKNINSKKKAKPILVDIIEDEPMSALAEELALENEDESGDSFQYNIKNNNVDTRRNEDIDIQKKFFSSLSLQTNADSKDIFNKVEKSENPKRSVGLYRRLVIKFIILVGLLALVVSYFSFSKLNVLIDLNGETISDNLLFKVSNLNAPSSQGTDLNQNDPRQPLSGVVKVINASIERTYAASGESNVGEEIVGQVRIINKYNKSQALVAKTRLLSRDNKLFRIKNPVNVPAGGEVLVDIYADKPGEDMAIAATDFTIPGLWLGLQDKIYARSDESFLFTKKVKKYILVEDIDRATQDISAALIDEAKSQAVESGANGEWLYLSNDSPGVSLSAKRGDQQDSFTAKTSGQVIAVNFSRDEAARFASAKLNLLVPDDKELADFKPQDIAYTLENYDADSQVATVKAVFSGVMILKSNAEVIDPEQLVNLSSDQIGTYLKGQPEIKNYELDFSPSFIKKAPSLVDRITIKINK